MPRIRSVIGQGLQNCGEVGRHRRLRIATLPKILQRAANHGLHLSHIALDARALLAFGQEAGAQPQPGQRRAKIMAQRRQRLGAVLDQPDDPGLHRVEGLRRVSHLDRPIGGQRGGPWVSPHLVRGFRQAAQRLGHPADDRDGGEKDSQGHGPHGNPVRRQGWEARDRRPGRNEMHPAAAWRLNGALAFHAVAQAAQLRTQPGHKLRRGENRVLGHARLRAAAPIED